VPVKVIDILEAVKKIIRFLRQYRLFSLALAAVIAGVALELAGQHKAAHWLLAIVALVELGPLLYAMSQDLRSGRYGIDILAATAILASVILGQQWAAIVLVFMLTGGAGLEDFAEHRARSELDTLLKLAPQRASVIRKGKVIEVGVEALRVGDKVVIKPGEVVPVDAVIIDGSASFDEASLTGESLPQEKLSGDKILSGSVNLDGAITAKTTANANDSQYQQIIKLVKSASANQTPFVRLADRYSIPFTFLAFAIAIGVWAFSGQAIRFLEVIVVATPCPLLLAAPIAVISGMARASRFGIIVKTGSALERLAQIKTIAFDKTGTVTTGILKVEGVKAYGKSSPEEVLAMAAGLEQNSNHVVAAAIISAAGEQNIKYGKAKHVKEISGRGLQAQLKGRSVLAGRLSLLKEEGVKLPARFNENSAGKTAVYIALDGELAGAITLSDQVRPESQATLNHLRQMGLKNIVMVTGDNRAAAQAIAEPLGISEIHADALPAGKLHVIEKLSGRPVAFVGDGVNDAPVLTAADVGIALGARGSTAASESADMVIMLDEVGRVAAGVEIAKRTFAIARQSILIGIGMSAVLMLVFATGKLSPLTGAVAQEAIDVFVIFNALRAHLITPSGIRQD
jgi:heavy metal translocating P-type ATPase